MNEVISYMFPFVRNGEGLSPVLTYECDHLPIKATFDIAFYFMSLKNHEVYRLWFDIKKDNQTIINDSWDRDKIFKAEDPESKPDEIAVGLNVKLPDLPFSSVGIYEVEAKLYTVSSPMVPTSISRAFFKIKEKRAMVDE